MQQHPVPQHISSYEFKLVGDMTLKQFFQLAGGLVISLVFYATPLPGFIKWPLVVLFGLAGAALAFLPIEERPLSQWVFAFIKAIYSPTVYAWNAAAVEDVFARGGATALADPSQPAISQVEQTEEVQKFEQGEKNFISRITVLFAGSSQTPNMQQVPVSDFIPAQSSHSTGSGQAEPFAMGAVLSQDSPVPQTPQRHIPQVVEMAMAVPTSAAVKVGAIPVQAPQSPHTPDTSGTLTPVFASGASQKSTAGQAIFAPEAAPPAPPERPNTIVGQVISADGKIVEGAIMEIKDATSKTPVRALRSNKVGHFITVTPVLNGVYEIVTEKEGLTFDTVQFAAEGRLIPPIQIKAK